MNEPSVPNPRPVPRPRADYRHFTGITTRRAYNGACGHVNNVVHASHLDTVVNQFARFAAGQPLSAAHGHFVHVYVDRATRRSTALTAPLVQTLQGLL